MAPCGVRRYGRLACKHAPSGAAILVIVLLFLLSTPVGASPTWRLTEVSVVGAGPEEPLFTWVRQVAFGGEGELLVLDGRRLEVFITDVASGRLLRRVGGRGAGPGEFLDPSLLAAASDGSFEVFDLDAGSRLSRFSSDGQFLGSTDVGAAPSSLVWDVATTAAGTFLLVRPSSIGLRRGTSARHPRLLFLGSGRGSGPTVVFDWKDLGMEPMQARDPGDPIPFNVEPRAIWSLLPDGRHAVARNDRYEVTILDDRGEAICTLRRDLPLRPMTAAMKEDALSELSPALRELGIEWGDYLAAIASVYPGPDGTVLVLRGSDDGPTLDVFSASCELIGEIRLPEGFRLMAARDGLLAGTVTTADEETAVKVLRLER